MTLLLPPEEELLYFSIFGYAYTTTARLFFTNEGDGSDNSILEMTDRMRTQSEDGRDDRLEDSELSWYATSDTIIPLVLEGIGIEIDGIESIDFEGEEIRNDFLRTIEIDRDSNAFSSSS